MTLLCPLPGCRILRVARDGPDALLIAAEIAARSRSLPRLQDRQHIGPQPLSSPARRPARERSSGAAEPDDPALLLPPSLLPAPHLRRAAAAPARPPCSENAPAGRRPSPNRARARWCTRRPAAVAPRHADERHGAVAGDPRPAALGPVQAEHRRRRRLGAAQGAHLRHHPGRPRTPSARRPAAGPRGFDAGRMAPA